MVKESDIQRSILDWLNANGYFCLRVPLGGVAQSIGNKVIYKRNPMRGFPDILGLMKQQPGFMFVIEVKTPKGVLSKEQKAMREQLENRGVVYILARCLADVIEELYKYDRPHHVH